MTQPELAAYVQSYLEEKGIHVILSGGAAVSVYTNRRYVTGDIDFVNVRFADRARIKRIIEEIGFKEVGRHFEHPDTEWFLEFPPGPLALGGKPIKDIESLKYPTGILRLISPTECVKDRLAHYIYWDDLQCLDQAFMVIEEHEVEIEEILSWAKKEDGENYEKIKIRLEEN
jgi:hypothetical protein